MNHIALRLKEIYLGQRTGRLEFFRIGIHKEIFFQDGGLIFAKTNVSEERLGEILLKTGKIKPEVHADISRYAQPRALLGESLVQSRVLSQRDLYDGLLAQMYAVVLGCFHFFDGDFEFTESERFFDPEFELRVSLPLLIEKGIRSMSYHAAIPAFFAGQALLQKKSPLTGYLSASEKTLWEKLDGKKKVEFLMAREAADPEVFWKTLFLLYGLDLAAFADPAAAEPEPPRPKRSAAGSKRQDAGSKSDLDERLHEALELRKKLHLLDPRQILGVTREAGDEEIKKAYFKFARKFHPDLFGRSLDPAFREQIAEVFDGITKAYRTLSSKPDGEGPVLSPGIDPRSDNQDIGKLADTRFRQGKTLFDQARYEEAVLYLEEAVRNKSDKGDYYLLLAMAESKIPALSRKAERDFLRAIDLEPWNPEGLIGAALLYKREGLTARAKRMLEKALEIDADHKAARQELDDLNDKSEGRKGLKGLFTADLFGSKKK